MNAKILNRGFEHPNDGWYQIEPKGDHPNRAKKVIQVIDDIAITAIVNRFNADAEAGKLSHGHEMLIDHEHFKHQGDKETIAYGWLQKLQNREDGIYGQIRWTNTGKVAVDGGDYRFFSTEYDPADLKILNSATPTRKRPERLDGLTLTNDPNNKGGKPITNRNNFPGSREPADSKEHQQQKVKSMKSVCALLGLSAEADETSVHAAVAKLLNRAEITPADLTKLQNRADITPDDLKLLRESNTKLLDEQVDALLAGHGVTEEKIINRLKPVLVVLKNREDRVATLVDLGHKALTVSKTSTTRVLNRKDSKTEQEEVDDTDGQALAEKITNRANELKGQSKDRPFDDCWNQAVREAAKTK